MLLEAADKLTTDAEALARGWETHLTIVTEALVPVDALFPLVTRLADKANTQFSLVTEVLAGAWERLEQGRADIVIAPDMHFRASTEINTRKLYTMMSVYVASADHPIHNEPEPQSEVTRVKYRGIAVADTARERPVLTVQLLDKQQRLTVSSMDDKRRALLAGLGVATMPYSLVEQDIAEGRLRVVSPEYTREVDIIMAWRRDSMGEAKSWCLREIPRLLAKKTKAPIQGEGQERLRQSIATALKRVKSVLSRRRVIALSRRNVTNRSYIAIASSYSLLLIASRKMT